MGIEYIEIDETTYKPLMEGDSRYITSIQVEHKRGRNKGKVEVYKYTHRSAWDYSAKKEAESRVATMKQQNKSAISLISVVNTKTGAIAI